MQGLVFLVAISDFCERLVLSDSFSQHVLCKDSCLSSQYCNYWQSNFLKGN